jgi:hypothetical protein
MWLHGRRRGCEQRGGGEDVSREEEGAESSKEE